MPLSAPAPRKFAEQRSVVCQGYRREDGLWDIEGVLTDTRSVDTTGGLSREVPAGEAIHQMHVRLTLDDTLVIQAIEVAMDAHPYRSCSGVRPNFQRLVGMSVGRGFAKQLFSAVGHAEGCTHVVSLIQSCATVAVRTVGGSARAWGNVRESELPPGERPRLLDTCHGFSASGPQVMELWPSYYRPASPANAGAADEGEAS